MNISPKNFYRSFFSSEVIYQHVPRSMLYKNLLTEQNFWVNSPNGKNFHEKHPDVKLIKVRLKRIGILS